MSKAVAVVGYAFRLPGASDDRLWDLLCEGRDLVTEVEDTRWAKEAFYHPDRSEPGCSYTFAAGSVGDVKGFDAAFFGISPREAEQMDPQQRFLLEMTWEAFESGGIKPSSVRGSDTGVFVAYSGTDYPYRRVDDLATVDASSMTGNTGSVAANRLSYWFDLRGPSMAVDTACSSSLVAFHQAWQSIQAGDVSQAVVGGIALHLHPFPFVGFAKASMLSPRGVCNVFDAAGDGYVRSEGGGVFFLKDLSQARADGNQIFAIVAGSGVNCDGRTNGITVPGMETQAELLRSVYRRAGIDPQEVDYLEAHGTGTAVGDPIETGAIAEVFGHARPPANPLPIGSVKSNLGHLETAAGVAGLVKSLYCLRHRKVPPTIHLDNPNPNIPFDEWNLKVVTEALPLSDDKPLVIGVNSFGFGGANAHVVLRSDEPHVEEASRENTKEPVPLVLSARSPVALRAMATRYGDYLRDNPGLDLYDMAYSALMHRELLEHRALVCADDRDALVEVLRTYARGETPEGLAEGSALDKASRPVFVYSGNGSQWAGMGQALLAHSGRFREVVEEIDQLLLAQGGDSVIEDLQRAPGEDRYALTEVAQPALFAVQVGVTEILRDWGVMPAAVVGHSVGEVAAAWASGALSLSQAVRVIHARSVQQANTRGDGGMTAVGLSEVDATALLCEVGAERELTIAGINSPRGITLAGPIESLEGLETVLAEREVFHRRLPLDYAFHSTAMEPIRVGLQQALADLKPRSGAVPFYSTVTGTSHRGEGLDASYWWRNVREPVRFEPTIRALVERGFNVFVEIGPHAVLRHYVSDCLRTAGIEGRVLATLARTDDRPERVRDVFFQLYIAGSLQDLHRLFPRPGRFVDLPRYAWQHEAYWLEPTVEGVDTINRRHEHPLLGYRLHEDAHAWESRIDVRLQPELADHRVGDAILFPAAGFVEMALAAARLWQADSMHTVEELEIRAPLLLERTSAKLVRFQLDERDGGFQIVSRDRLSDGPWLSNAVGRLLGETAPVPNDCRLTLPERPADWRADFHYALTTRVGLDYGPAFRAVESGWCDGDTVIAVLRSPDEIADDLVRYHLHPSVLDGCFQLLVDHLSDEVDGTGGVAFVPVRIARLSTRLDKLAVRYVRSRLVGRGPRSIVADFELFDRDRRLLAEARGVRFRGVQLRRNMTDHTGYLRYRLLPRPRHDGWSTAWVPSFEKVLDVCATSLALPQRQHERARYYDQVEPLLDVLCAAFAQQALRGIVSSDRPFDASTLVAAGAVSNKQYALVERLIGMLQEDGILEPADETGVRWVPDANLPDPQDVWISLLGDYPDYAAEFLMAARVGMHLDEVLTGEREPVGLVPRPCTSNTFSQYVGGSPTLRRIDGVIADLVRELQADLPAHGRLRILHIGSCRSRLIAQVLGQVDMSRCDYVLAVPGSDVLENHEELLERFPGVRAVVVDPAEPVVDWGANSGGDFDLVLCGNVLHDLPDPERTLSGLRELTCPDAIVAVVEQQASRWVDLVFGLDPQWWSGGDAKDMGFGTVAAREVAELLLAAGFERPTPLWDYAHGESGPYAVIAGTGSAQQDPAVSGQRVFALVRDATGYSAALAEALAAGLREAGQSVVQVEPGECFTRLAQGYRVDLSAAESIVALIDEVREIHGRLDAFVWLQGLQQTRAHDIQPKTLMDGQIARCTAVSVAFQACEQQGILPDAWLVTSGAAPASIPGRLDPGPPAYDALTDAPLWGFGRSLINEYPDTAVRLIDLAETDQIERMAAGLLDEFLHPTDDEEIVLTGDGRFVASVVPLGHEAGGPGEVEGGDAHERAVVLDFRVPGPLKHLNWMEREIPALGPEDVQIDVRAAGLNFRDVMYAMGLLSDEAVENGFAGPTLGMEVAGVVSRVGGDVRTFAVGDEVIAFAPAGFATRTVTHADAVVAKPDDWSHEAAATIPTTFFTAYYALHHLARLQPGERVLIHGAAGGVGIAAIQLAKYLGAEVFATAGSNEKRDFVRLLGADHVMDSRSLTFADEILEITAGVGIDVVLNSLAGEAINRNLRVLRPFGRFLELGKRDYYENTRIGLRPFRNNIAYFGIDADQLMAERPALTRRLFTELMTLFSDSSLKPLPYRAFPAEDAVDAFRYMQQSKQIGKIVLTFDKPPRAQALPVSAEQGLRLSDNATYLVTGGLGGFGARTALWLAEKGARNLVLLSRRGPEAPEANDVLTRLAEMGVTTRPFACDITDREALQRVLATIGDAMPPLRGIVHAAMVIDDGLVRNMTADRIRAVFAPKILGALHLDQLTREMALDFFVLYSSATTLFGNPGQASYVGANRFLEALAETRRRNGLPALCVSWGAIEDVGYLARNDEVKASLQSRMGGAALNAHEALDVLEQLLLNDRSGLAVLDLDWNALRRFLPSADSPRFVELSLQAEQAMADAEDLEEIQRWVAELSTDELTALFIELMKKELSEILRLAPERIDEHRSLYDLGMDSLMGVELVAAVETRFGVALPVMALSEGPSLVKLVDRIVGELKTPGSGETEAADVHRLVRTTAEKHGQEVDRDLLDEVATHVEQQTGENVGSLLH